MSPSGRLLAACAAAAVLCPLPGSSHAPASAAQTTIPPAVIQPHADRLLDHAGLLAAVTRIAASRRATAITIGTSAGGLAIPMIALTAPGTPPDELRSRAVAISGPRVAFRSLAAPLVTMPEFDRLVATARVPILLAGSSWGHEAAQVEGLIAAADHLAFDQSPDTGRLLERLIVLIVPCMNPDGRQRAIAAWRRVPLSAGEDAVGNADGFMINRDFIHQTQPESRAILDVTREWRPVVGIDLHEDMQHLGVAIPEVAFVPPFMPGFDVEEHPATRKAIAAVGAAIARKWREAGYGVVYDPEGDRRWVPLPPKGSAEINPIAGSSGRLEFLWNIHAVTGLITESARTPGTQTWDARVDQKRLAALATVEEVAARPEFYARVAFDRRREAVEAGLRTGEFVALPRDQPAGAHAGELHRVLRAHDVVVFEAAGERVDVIPLAQPEAPFIRHAILAERSKLNDLPAALGVRIVRSRDLPTADRDRLRRAAVRSGSRVAWPWPAPASSPLSGRVAVYRGQGIDRVTWGELAFVLRAGGISPVLLDEDDVRAGRWKGALAIVVGDGAAREIVDGWDLNAPARRPPWQPATPSRGIGVEGVRHLAVYVREGGRLVTLGRSAGLVTHAEARLADLTLLDDRPGIGQVRLRVHAAGRALFRGVPQESGFARAFVYAPPGGPAGGVAFTTRNDAQVAASYAGAVDVEAEQSFATSEPLAPSRGAAAILVARAGRGAVVTFGIAPTFRAQWRSTFPLLYRAVNPRTQEP